MNVFSGLNAGNHSADVLAVLGDRVTDLEVSQGQFVPKCYVHSGAHFEWSLIVQRHTFGQIPRLDVDHRHADIIFLVVNQKVDHTEKNSWP